VQFRLVVQFADDGTRGVFVNDSDRFAGGEQFQRPDGDLRSATRWRPAR
jgi:hypothetical protein